MDFQEPLPYRFNPWKHHRQWVCQQIEEVQKTNNNKLLEDVLNYIKTINSNHVDVYTGQFLPYEIIQNVTLELDKLKITNKQQFTDWLGKASYRLISLSDASVWVVREGKEDERYIHFHPARNFPNAMRIHGNSWKTVIALKLLYPLRSNFSLSDVNEIRKKYLNLSPIKGLDGSMRLQSAFELLGQRQ